MHAFINTQVRIAGLHYSIINIIFAICPWCEKKIIGIRSITYSCHCKTWQLQFLDKKYKEHYFGNSKA